MDAMRKRSAMIGFLICFALWPALHHVLVRHFEMNPWKFFGWSMYCVPATFVHVSAFEREGHADHPIDLASIQEKVDEFVHDRWVYGTLLTPRRIAPSIFE